LHVGERMIHWFSIFLAKPLVILVKRAEKGGGENTYCVETFDISGVE